MILLSEVPPMRPENTAILTAAITVLGWFVLSTLSKWRDDRTYRLRLAIEHSERQVSEYYGPLTVLVRQLDEMAKTQDEMLANDSDLKAQISEIAYKDIFAPLHHEINVILKTKLHLAEGREYPPSVNDYLKHYATEFVHWRLRENSESEPHFQVASYPGQFYHDVEHGLNDAIARYEKNLEQLRPGFRFSWT